ncbi:hypothetical protein [Modestobacter excelsi]|nr:hypothetical protein [Modestobacter excelsi]
MTTTAVAPGSKSADPAITLADALQSGFAAQRSGCQRTRTAR